MTDDEGHQMVVTDDGTLMSAEQYRVTGSSKTLISNSNTGFIITEARQSGERINCLFKH